MTVLVAQRRLILLDCSLPGSCVDGILQEKYWSGYPFLSPGNLPDQRLNLGLPHYRSILYHLSLQGSFYQCQKQKSKVMKLWVTTSIHKDKIEPAPFALLLSLFSSSEYLFFFFSLLSWVLVVACWIFTATLHGFSLVVARTLQTMQAL